MRGQHVGQDPKGGEREKFPDTYDMKDGSEIVALATEVKTDVKTQYGPRTVLHVLIRPDADKKWSLWWPSKLSVPMLNVCFYLRRVSKKEYILAVADNDEESEKLWKDGMQQQPLGEKRLAQPELPKFIKR